MGLDYDQGIDPHDPHLRIEQNHYLDFPVMKKDFSNWQTVGAAVMLRNKAVLAPEVKDKKGIILSKLPNPLSQSWQLDVSVEIGNDQRSQRGGTGLGIFYLKALDSQHVSHKESIFGYTNRFEGLGIYINTVLKGDQGKKGEVLNAIQGFVNDGNRAVNVFVEKRHLCWRSVRNQGQPLHLRVIYSKPLVTVQVFDFNTQAYDLCFSFETPLLDFQGHFLLSGSSGVHNPDHVYLHSIKLYDPHSPSTNDHFLSARKAKFEHELQQKVSEGVRDLFERHSEVDLATALGQMKIGIAGNHTRDATDLLTSIPIQHQHLSHKLQEALTEVTGNSDRFFENMRGIPQLEEYNKLKEKLFTFRLKIDQVNQELDKELKKLNTFDKTLKQIKHTNNLQRGLLQREVNNQHTKKLHFDLAEVERIFQQVTIQFRDYQQAMETLSAKVRQESGFTKKLEDERRQFAKEMSGRLVYDMREIDDVFNEMEINTVTTGWSNMILNFGMILVILVSGLLWCKMNKFETKNE